jgi:hypothetical protein
MKGAANEATLRLPGMQGGFLRTMVSQDLVETSEKYLINRLSFHLLIKFNIRINFPTPFAHGVSPADAPTRLAGLSHSNAGTQGECIHTG